LSDRDELIFMDSYPGIARFFPAKYLTTRETEIKIKRKL